MNSAEKKIIFLVDDDVTNLTIGKKALSGTYNVLTLDSGARLFSMLEKVTPDLILLDVNMPGMGGYEVIRLLKSTESNHRYTNIPVIFLTALMDEKSELEGLSLGAIDYITKPFSVPLLLQRIEIHLLVESQRKELVNFNTNLQTMVDDRTEAIVQLKNAFLSTMAELVESRDSITGGHIDRTQMYMKVMIDAMRRLRIYEHELSELNEEGVLISCMLHDVGKISIKDAILNKPGKLTEEEFESMKAHTTFGEQIIQNIKNKTEDSEFLEYARIFAISHHEKWDGSGYPKGLKAEEIPLLGRIMAIVDVYDALVEERPYKPPFTHEKAVQIISEGKGLHFDPKLVDLFTDVNKEFQKVANTIK